LRGIVLLVDNSDLSRIIYHSLAGDFKIDSVIREAKLSRLTLIRRRVRKLGWTTVLGQILFTTCILPILKRETAHRRREILLKYQLNNGPIPAEQLLDVRSVNDDETISLFQKLSPRVIVVNGTRILDERLLNATNGIFLNTHVGITPLYRGVHGGYWALAANDPDHFGVTIHRIDKGIDTGDIIAQAIINPVPTDNFSTYPLLQIAVAIPLLKQAIHNAMYGTLETMPAPSGKSKLWSHPTVLQYVRRRLTAGVR
jgi:folate-dependent phosphoribosylglycinamide formyltransferase PurN